MTSAVKKAPLAKNKDEEIQKNYEAFKRMLPELIKEHRNKYALMRGEELIAVYSTAQDAAETGKNFYEDGLFSIQEITDVPADLGFYSHAVCIG